MNLLSRPATLVALIASTLAFPTASVMRAQTPQYQRSRLTPDAGLIRSAATHGGGPPDAGVPFERSAGTFRDGAGLPVSNAVHGFATQQLGTPRTDDALVSRSADNWKRARIVGYTLGAIVAGVVAYVAYNVLTGT